MIKLGRGGSLLRPPSSKSGLRKGERGSVPSDLIPLGVSLEEGLSVRLHPPRCRGVIVVSTTPSLQRPITQTHESGWIARLGGWSAAHLRVVIVG